MAKILEEDETGSRRFVWRKTGADHYAHALNYALLASQRIRVYEPDDARSYALRMLSELEQDRLNSAYDPLTYGLNVNHNSQA